MLIFFRAASFNFTIHFLLSLIHSIDLINLHCQVYQLKS